MRKISYTAGGINGEKVELQESNDMVAVRTKNGKSLSEALQTKPSKETIAKLNVKQKIPRADVTILEVKKTRKKKLQIRNEARSHFKNENDVRFAGRVLVDKGTNQPVLYTENIFVRFKPVVTQKSAEKIIKAFNLTVKDKVKYAPNTYFVKAPEGIGMDVFTICKKIAKKRKLNIANLN